LEKIIVFKCGGSSVDELSTQFFTNIHSLMEEGWKPVIVHGGGPAIQNMLEKLNITFEFVDGLRKTTAPMMEVVEMILTGEINPQLTRKLNKNGIKAVGISGSDYNLLKAKPINKEKYGQVGEVSEVNANYIKTILEEKIVPVISPVAIGKDYSTYNINADTAAGAIASALGAKRLVFVTDVPGILKDEKLLEKVTENEISTMIESGIIYGGMIPKVKAALHGLQGNVPEVMIINGKNSEPMINGQLKGTTITNKTGVATK